MFLNRYRRNSSASYMQVIGAFRESICIVSSGTFFERPRLEGMWSIFSGKKSKTHRTEVPCRRTHREFCGTESRSPEFQATVLSTPSYFLEVE